MASSADDSRRVVETQTLKPPPSERSKDEQQADDAEFGD